jgi:hypothetical protein
MPSQFFSVDSSAFKPGEECTVVVMGRVFRCIIDSAFIRSNSRHQEIRTGFGEVSGVVTMEKDIRMTCEYRVLSELTPQDSAAVQAVIEKIAPLRRALDLS